MMIRIMFPEGSPAVKAKLKDPHMTLDNNPLYKPETEEERIMRRNEKRLYRDVERRENPLHGRSYSAFMDTMRFKNMKGE